MPRNANLPATTGLIRTRQQVELSFTSDLNHNNSMQNTSWFDSTPSRRTFLSSSAALAGAGLALGNLTAAEKKRPKVAVIFTVMTYRTHAHVILENFLEPYLFNGKKTDPGVEIVSFYADQLPGSDMSRTVAKEYGIPTYKSIEEALCLGGKELAVDAVLSIGEHGSYPVNALGQREYPRKRFFDEAVAVMRRSKRAVPFFNDKHLSYRWDWAKEMYDTARELGIPLMAGTSVALAQRRPNLDLPRGAEIEEAVVVHGGPIESYDFHGLELLQSMVEARMGGETGVSRVEFLERGVLASEAKTGRWSIELAEAAMAAQFGGKLPSLVKFDLSESPVEPHGIRVTYKDGLTGLVLRIGQDSTRWNFACRLKGDPKVHATSFYVGPWQNRCLFKALSHAIQHHFIHGKAPYPVERTLLVSGILDAVMHARQKQEEKALDTPQLEFAYAPRDFRAMREMGDSWKILTPQTPQPNGLHKWTESQ